MSRWFAVLIGVAFLSASVYGQDEIVKDFSANQVAGFLRDHLRIETSRHDLKDRILFETPNDHFNFEVLVGPVRAIVLRYPFRALKLTPETINEWNRRDGAITRAFMNQGRLELATAINVDAGLSIKQFAAIYDQAQRERVAFIEIAEKGPKAAPKDDAPRDLTKPDVKQAPPKDPLKTPPVVAATDGADVVRQKFPAAAAKDDHQTMWEIEWDFAPNPFGKVHLLRIVSAKYSFKDKTGAWKSVVVARNMELVEAFAAYDDGITTYLDLAFPMRANWTIEATKDLQGPSCVSPPEILTYSKNSKLKIFREVHDDGIRWLSGYANESRPTTRGHRGEKLILSSMFQAVNYSYIVSYEFTDDGRIVPRLGFTAHNYFKRGEGRSKVPEGDVHMHVGCWRFEFDLTSTDSAQAITGGPDQNDYRLISRRFDKAKNRFLIADEPFGSDGAGQALEGKAQWKAEEFTLLRAQSISARNGHKRPIAYDLMPSRAGSVRDLKAYGDTVGKSMDFINYDFWIAQHPAPRPYHDVGVMVAEKRPLAGKRAVIFYSAPALHSPRGEDFGGTDGTSPNQGAALTNWIEFTLRPRDLFDSTPFYR